MNIQRGYRSKIESFFDVSSIISIRFNIEGSSVYDISCFGLNAEGKLLNEEYMVFYNQLNTPNNSIVMQENEKETIFKINMKDLPSNADKLSFTISIDGSGKISDMKHCIAEIFQNGKESLILDMCGGDFSDEKAIILIELYKKPDWRINAIARGFNGGLSELLNLYGGEEEKPVQEEIVVEQPKQINQNTQNIQNTQNTQNTKVSLEKRLLEEAPKLVSLAKPIQLSLERNNITDITARVGLVMDISGSMTQRYKNGTVQMVVNKVVPLALQFDTDSKLDFWYYGTHTKEMPEVTVHNYETAVPKDWKGLMYSVGASNFEPEAIEKVIEKYKKSKVPAYVIFITDGGVGGRKKIENLMIEASNYPIFWQFVGVGGYGYGILKKLDELKGRIVDNAGFFAIDDFKTISDIELYDRLLSEFPLWLKAAKEKNII